MRGEQPRAAMQGGVRSEADFAAECRPIIRAALHRLVREPVEIERLGSADFLAALNLPPLTRRMTLADAHRLAEEEFWPLLSAHLRAISGRSDLPELRSMAEFEALEL